MSHPAAGTIRGEHAAVAAVLRSILKMVSRGGLNDDNRRERRDVLQSLMMMLRRGPGDDAACFFDVLQAMLFYIAEFPARLNHAAESGPRFSDLVRRAPQLTPGAAELEADSMKGEAMGRELQHLLLAWELLGAPRRTAFEQAAQEYVRFYLDAMRNAPAPIGMGTGSEEAAS